MRFLAVLMAVALLTGSIAFPQQAGAQSEAIRVATVTRAPFSFEQDGSDTGFSIDLLEEVAGRLGRPVDIIRYDGFSEMLNAVVQEQVDLAAANISVTSAREEVMDFSRPIFGSGLQIMVPAGAGATSVLPIIFSRDILLAVVGAFALLLACGMIMWRLERNAQPYFEGPARQAAFPAFWWALNLIVNGGFEERVPRTAMGRVLGTFLVVASLFLVSIFVAKITTVMTVSAIESSINGPDDLYGKRVATVEGSTAAGFLEVREIRYRGYADLASLLDGFEKDQAEAVVFDAPILAYYTAREGAGVGELAGSVFLRENYGFAMQQNSDLAEPINRELLRLREDGTYNALHRKWFGTNAP